jgi:hypothetical protein
MLRRSWRPYRAARGFLVALCLSVPPLAAAQPEPQRVGEVGPSVPVEDAQTAECSADSSGSRPAPALPVRVIESSEESAHARDREQKSDQHEADDLAAQRKAADAADRSARAAEWQKIPTWVSIGVAGVGTVIALAGTIMLGFTLYWSRKTAEAGALSAEAAQNAVTAAQAALAHTQEISRKQIRAYVTVSGGEIKYNAAAPPVFSIDFINSGESPAQAARARFSAFAVINGEKRAKFIDTDLFEPIGKGQPFTFRSDMPTEVVTFEEMTLHLDSIHIEFFGFLDFSDVFEEKRSCMIHLRLAERGRRDGELVLVHTAYDRNRPDRRARALAKSETDEKPHG